MSTQVIDPDFQWKQAASQEGVDYDAVQKSFMDQSYGVVANKAKILFQDPFRLGFEIVHRNEKATKMVGIFAFRVNRDLLYAPTFFVNGEIKAADMLYRADVKRFVPLTEDWCAFLARGVSESAGEPTDKGRMRQADAYMDRLAYPQRVKYASEKEFVDSCMDTPCDKLIPELEKRASKAALGKLLSYLGVGTGGALLGSGMGYNLGEKSGLEAGGEDAVRNILAGMYRHLNDMQAQGIENPLPEDAFKSASEMEITDAEGVKLRDKFVKAAADGSLWRDMMLHCADNSPMRKLIPEVINEQGAEALEKLAGILEGNDGAERFLVENYSREDLETVDAWMAKKATPVDHEANSIVINLDPLMAKSAASRDAIFDKGYELIDKRAAESLNTIVEECGDGTVKELSSACCAEVLLDCGKLDKACLFRRDSSLLTEGGAYSHDHGPDRPECVYFPESGELLDLKYNQPVFGDELIDQDLSLKSVDANGLSTGKCYVALDEATKSIS